MPVSKSMSKSITFNRPSNEPAVLPPPASAPQLDKPALPDATPQAGTPHSPTTLTSDLTAALDPDMDLALMPDAPAGGRASLDRSEATATRLSAERSAERGAERAKRAEDWMRKAAMQAEQSDYLSAIDFYSQAIETDPSCARAYGNRGLLKGNLGNRMGAIADLRQAAQIFHARSMTGNYEMVLSYIKRLTV